MGKKSRRNRPTKQQGSSSSSRNHHHNRSSPPDGPLPPDTIDPEQRRDMADRFKFRFLSLPKDDFSVCNMVERCASFDQYRDILFYKNIYAAGKNFQVTIFNQEDYAFLKSLWKSKEEHAYVRARAYFARFAYEYENLRYEDAYQCLCTAFAIYRQAGWNQNESPADKWFAMDMSFPSMIYNIMEAFAIIAVGPCSTKAIVTFMGGRECDACGKEKTSPLSFHYDVHDQLHKCCGRCQMTFYCSSECQRSHWKIHKLQCRKEGEFYIGDTAYYYAPTDTTTKFSHGHIVELIALLPPPSSNRGEDETVSWFVADKKHPDSKRGCQWVEAKNLRRCRPAVWDVSWN